MKILCVVGARPNFIKLAALWGEMKLHPELDIRIVHTGQHYDSNMSEVFFEELGLPKPHYNLGVHGGTATYQVSGIMTAFEAVIDQEKPDVVIVFGDVNSTLAAALVTAQKGIRLVHVEAGMRSGEKHMKEEINRVLTDHLSDVLFATEEGACTNLINEGIADENIYLTGNVMIDTLFMMRSKAADSKVLKRFDLEKGKYVFVTLHRAETVDTVEKLIGFLDALEIISKEKPILFPVHPRTIENIGVFNGDVLFTEPLGYIDCIAAMDNAYAVITDSGGVQTEAYALGVPCIIVRETTEHKILLESGSNTVVGLNPDSIYHAYKSIKHIPGTLPKLWDGKASGRIVEIITRMAREWGIA